MDAATNSSCKNKKNDRETILSSAQSAHLKAYLDEKPRDLLLFTMAIETGLGMKDLLRLKISDLEKALGERHLPPPRSKKNRRYTLKLTEGLCRIITSYINNASLGGDDFVFKSKKGAKPLNISSTSNLIKSWLTAIGIYGSSGSKILRETYEYLSEKPQQADTGEEAAESSTVLKPIKTYSKQEIVYRRLHRAITSGKIPPGAKISLHRISENFGVSQMPVREALRALEAKGYLSYHQNRGMIVSELTKQNFQDITIIRINLESLAAQRACRVRTEETLLHLKKLMCDYVSTDSKEDFFRINKAFHMALYKDAQMPILMDLILELWSRISPYLHLYMETRKLEESRSATVRFHNGMIEGLYEKNPEKVVRWLKSDIEGTIPKLTSIIKTIHTGD